MTYVTTSVLMCSSYTDSLYAKVVTLHGDYCKDFLHCVWSRHLCSFWC